MDKAKLKKIIGTNIKIYRKLNELKVDDLAKLLDLTPGYIGLIERGTRGATPLTLYKLSEIFNLSINDFFIEHDFSSLALKKDNCIDEKFNKIKAMLFGINQEGIDFVISTIKSYKLMQAKHEESLKLITQRQKSLEHKYKKSKPEKGYIDYFEVRFY